MDNIQIAGKILKILGGKKNIDSNSVCATKLRVKVKDSSIVELVKFMEIKEILGVSTEKNNVYNIVIEENRTVLIGIEFIKLTSLKNAEIYDESNEKKVGTVSIGAFSGFFRKIIDILFPLLPVLIGAGIIKGVISVVDILPEGEIFKDYWWYILLKMLSAGLFAYLPIFICGNTVKEFKGTPALGGIIGILFTGSSHIPILLEMGGKEAVEEFQKGQMASLGGIIPLIFAGILTAYIERGIRKITPKILDNIIVPLLTIILSSLITVSLLQATVIPLVRYCYGSLITSFEQAEVFGGFFLSVSYIPLVLLGVNDIFVPLKELMGEEAVSGVISYLIPVLMVASGGQVGAGLALFVKTKNKKLKKIIRNSLPLGILGVGEPLIYLGTLPLVRPFFTGCIGAGIGGMLAGLLNLGTEYRIEGIFGFLVMNYDTGNQFIISIVGSYLGGFILTYFLGINEKRINEIYVEDKD